MALTETELLAMQAQLRLVRAVPAEPALTLPCPFCLVPDVVLSMSDGEFYCQQCDEAITADAVVETIAALKKWEKVFAWMGGFPRD